MVLDAIRNLIAVKNEYIFLSVEENICLDIILQHKHRGICGSEIKKISQPYNLDPQQVITRINRKIKKYGKIYSYKQRYKIKIY